MGISDDIMELSIMEDEASIGISEDIIEESIIDEDSMDDEASWAITGSARTAATAVVASRVRIIVGSLGSTLAVGQPRGAVPGWVQAPRGSDHGPTCRGPTCSALSGLPSKLPQRTPAHANFVLEPGLCSCRSSTSLPRPASAPA